MPLNPSTLSDELLARVFNAPSAEVAVVAQGWADAYGIFAAGALGCGTPPAPGAIDAAVVRLRNGLIAAFVGIDPATTTLGMQAAFQAFWTGFTFVGAAVVVPGAPTLAASLLLQWVGNPLVPTKEIAAALHATTLAVWSLTVVCGPPCNAPIV